MRITETGKVGDYKSYSVLLADEEIISITDKLFGDISITPKINTSIIDELLSGYLKTVAVDELNKKYPLLEGEIYKLEILTSKADPIVTMVSLHDKIKKIFY